MTVEFAEVEGGTEVIIKHEGIISTRLRVALVWHLPVPEEHPKIAQSRRAGAGFRARRTDAVP